MMETFQVNMHLQVYDWQLVWKIYYISIVLVGICLQELGASLIENHYGMTINMPEVSPKTPDAYICTAKKLTLHESYIVQYEPDANGRTAHHMLLFGCKSLHSLNHIYPGHWNCGHGDLCSKMTIMYGWAKNAPAMALPPDVGFLTGGNSSIQYLVLQIHYANPLPDGITDNSGLKLHMTTERQTYMTGIHLLLANSAEIPPDHSRYHIDINCRFQSRIPIYLFAYRVHTHKLGTVVTGYKFSEQNNNWTLLAKGNPQWPQAFYPMNHIQRIVNNDILAARCTYNSSQMNRHTVLGPSSNDEMCNLYLMYYTESRDGLPYQTSCTDVQFGNLVDELPAGSDVLLPPNLALEQHAQSYGGHLTDSPITYKHLWNEQYPNFSLKKLKSSRIPASKNHISALHQKNNFDSYEPYEDTEAYEFGNPVSLLNSNFKYQEVDGWPSKFLKFGQIAAVTMDKKGNVAVFHRGDHVWNELTFNIANKYNLVDQGPISVSTVIILDPVTGQVLFQWGNNLFFMPHGLFIDEEGTYWLTDVALHQVFKFSSTNLAQPLLTLGEKFVPGNDESHFCKPTSVAISKSGDIYVADGYCNSRILRFSSEGKFLNKWGKATNLLEEQPSPNKLNIPHKVVLIEDKELVCVADRENGRIQCFAMITGHFRFQIIRKEFEGRLFSLAYSQAKGGLLYAVSGEAIYKDHPVKAFVFNITNRALLNVFSPKVGTFTTPHDIAASHDGEEVYVCEIGPNQVWKFIRDYHRSTKKVLSDVPSEFSDTSVSPVSHNLHEEQPISVHSNTTLRNKEGSLSSEPKDETNNFETSMIIMALLTIPVLLLILTTAVIRLRKRGKLQNCSFGHLKGWLGGYKTPHPQEKFNLGNLLNPHKGFDRVAMEESDGDGEDGSDSDVEEFSAISKKA